MPARANKTDSVVAVDRVTRSLQAVNAIRNLTPAKLATQLDSFSAGHVKAAAMTWDKMLQRDDLLMSVVPKRKKAVSRHGYEIVTKVDTPQAQLQKEAAEHFFSNLTATSVLDRDERSGMSLLLRQMMNAVGMKYCVHEIVYEPRGADLTATFIQVPLWFFERTTGRLRYLTSETATKGEDLVDGEWLRTVGDGLMTACSVLFMFKHMPLKDWIIYCERHGMPGLHAKTDAAKGSDEWNTLRDAVQNFGVDWSLITNSGAQIEPVDMSSQGELPYPKLIERMDRANAAIWRGADLSTMSAGSGEGTGASLQGDESDILEEDDARLCADTLNREVLPYVIYYTTRDRESLVEVKINVPARQNVKEDLIVDDRLIKWGVPVSMEDILQRYNRPMPDPDETLISGAGTPAPAMPNVKSLRTGTGGAGAIGGAGVTSAGVPDLLGNEAQQPTPVKRVADQVRRDLVVNSRREVARAQADDLSPVRARVAHALDQDDPEFFINALRNLRDDLPAMLLRMNEDPRTAVAIESALAAAAVNGWAEGVIERGAAPALPVAGGVL